MISFDFAYFKPDTLSEAIECYHDLASGGQSVLYYGGGTEIISMARADSIKFDAVIELKNIPECNVLSTGGGLIIGSCVTLTRIEESGCFPLLCKTVSRIADHTIQGKITLGGNLCGTIVYREAALPLMITNSRARIMTKDGLKEMPFGQIFNGQIQMEPGDFLVQILIDQNELNLPCNHVKKTKMDKIDYPLITLASNKKNDEIHAAVSGIANMPLLFSSEMLNHASMSEEERISEVVAQINDLIISDIHASKEYRIFVLRNILTQMYENLRGA